MYSDASHSRWGGCLVIPGQSWKTRGRWDVESCALPIAVKESLALLRALESLAGRVHDAFVDNKVLLTSLENQLSRLQAFFHVLKSLFEFTYARNLHLSLVYVPSKESPANGPSRVVSDLECTLSPVAWQRVDSAFGPHTLDLMATWKVSSSPCPVLSLWCWPLLKIFPVFLCGRTAQERLRCTTLLVNFLTRWGLPGAHALPPRWRVRWIALLGNCGLYSLTWGMVVTGKIFLAWEIPPCIPALSVTLLHYKRNRPVPGLPQSRPRPSSLTSFFNFEHFSEATSL